MKVEAAKLYGADRCAAVLPTSELAGIVVVHATGASRACGLSVVAVRTVVG